MTYTTLINPPTILNLESLSFTDSIPPLGLAYLSSVAKRAGHKVQVIDSPGEGLDEFHPIEGSSIEGLYIHGITLEEIVRRIDSDTQLVGITNMYLHSVPLILTLCRKIKEKIPNTKIVLGGETPSVFWEHMMGKCSEIDFCVLGEGEQIFVELLEAIEKNISVSQISGLVYRDLTGKAIQTQDRQKRIKDVDGIGLPDWESFNVDGYLGQEYNFSSGVDRGRSMPILSTRGCPYQCTFCSSPKMWTTTYRTRTPKLVVDEIEWLIQRYKVDNLDFVDLTAITKRSWILEFCKELGDRNINITWQLPQGTRSEMIDTEVVTALYKAGCRNLTYGPESGSPRLLKEIKKRANLEAMEKSIRGANKVGLNTHVNLIIGMPGETWHDLWLTYKFLLKMAFIGTHSLSDQIFGPYPGSAMYDELVEAGKINFDDEAQYYGSLLRGGKILQSYNDNYDYKLLRRLQLFGLISFWGLQYLCRPHRLVKTIYNLTLGGAQESIMDNFLQSKRFYLKKKKLASDPISLY